MPETTNKTAMQILRDKIELRLATSQYHVVTNELMVLRNLIDTELLEVEKQHREDELVKFARYVMPDIYTDTYINKLHPINVNYWQFFIINKALY